VIHDPTELTLAEKALLTAGTDLWHTAAIERAGIPALRLTDGPNGARGDRWSSGASACLPCGSALAATWNRDLVRRIGRVLGDEARAKGAQVLLAPTVNIHRHPLGGRHFESFSEDPYLSAELCVAYIEGVQERGVSAVVKHFVCNDQEFERHSISVDVDERALREIYLPPFEAAVRRAGVWAIMSSYNRLGGTYCSEHHALLTDLLRREWGFQGLVVSDWRGTYSRDAIAAGLDLEMPGPAKFLGADLAAAVGRGEVPEAAVDRAASALIGWIGRTSGSPNGAAPSANPRVVAREAAAEAIVLLRNDGLLPLDAQGLERVALVGPLAARPAIQGGGSAEVTPQYVVTPLEALQERLGAQVQISLEPGCSLPGLLPVLDEHHLKDVRAEYYAGPDVGQAPQATETYALSRMIWNHPPAPGIAPGQFSVRVRGTFVPDRSGTWRFGLANAGQARLLVDGALVLDNFAPERGDTFFGQGSNQVTADLDVESGTRYQVEVHYRSNPNLPTAGVRIGAEPVLADGAHARAVAAAAQADVAILVVGYDGRWESEGFDRPHMDLPGEQTSLIRDVLAANPRTVVVVNAGAPVTMDWADGVPALLQEWFPGQEGSAALAQVLFGDVDPSGRLPTTFPRKLEDAPAFGNFPGSNGTVHYAEGLFVGYRHYDSRGVEPRFCFGYGLSFTTFAYSNLVVQADGSLTVDLTNTGARPGFEVVQVYVHDVAASVERPEQELVQFAKVHLAAGETRRVALTLDRRAFAYWDTAAHDWRVEPGEFEVRVGASSRDIRVRARINVP
jgi:beta-glucosidase